MTQFKSNNVAKFDQWIRRDFKRINTDLENLYLLQDDPTITEGVGGELKQELLDSGNRYIQQLLDEGNTDEGFDHGFDLLGNVGFFMAACRRHGVTDPAKESKSPLVEASALAMQLGASLGVIPRFASCHLETHNRAINGKYHTFTSLKDEKIFLDYNTRAVFAYMRASEALLKVLPLGVSHPVTPDLLVVARDALAEVAKINLILFEKLDTDHFFYCVRPYYKPHLVGLREYRGANAGDFAGINVIDLILGLCQADDSYYSQLLVDKFLYMRPEDQLILRDCMRRQSLLSEFLNHLEGGDSCQGWYQESLALFLQVCGQHGAAASAHHNQLISKFIEQPAKKAELDQRSDLTASGPPLPVLIKSLKKLCDMRCAAPSEEYKTSYAEITQLKQSLN